MSNASLPPTRKRSRIWGLPLRLARRLARGIGWYETPIRIRVAIFACLIILTQAVTSTLYGLDLYWKDREAYLFENHQLRSELVFQRLHETLLKGDNSTPFVPQSNEPVWLQTNLQIPRLPITGEVFLGVEETQRTLFWRDETGKLLKRTYSFSPEQCPPSAGLCYLISGSGVFLGSSNPWIINETNIRKRQTLVEALKGGMRKGFRIIKVATGADVAVSFQEAPGTNVLVFIETSTSSLVDSATTFLQRMTILSLLETAFAILLMTGAMSHLTRPILGILDDFKRIREGNFQVQTQHKYNDEFQRIIEGTQEMAHSLQKRDEIIHNVQRNLTEVLRINQDLMLADTCDRVATVAIWGICKNLHNASSPVGAILYEESFSLKPIGDCLQCIPGENGAIMSSDMKKTFRKISTLPLVTECTEVVTKGPLLVVPISSSAGARVCTLLVLSGNDVILTQSLYHYISTLSRSLPVLFDNIAQRREIQEFAATQFELDMASTLQATLLSEPPTVPGWALGSHFEAASKAGGDWYAFHYEPSSHLLFAILGDATGHGLPAAMTTVNACGAYYAALWSLLGQEKINTMAQAEDALRTLISMVGRSVLQATNEKVLMTCVALIIDSESGQGVVCNAGHHSPLLHRKKNNEISIVSSRGDILGLASSLETLPTIQIKPFTMNSGDRLLMYTDGLIENTGPNDAIFSQRSLRSTLAIAPGDETIPQYIRNVASEVWQNVPGQDDVTMVTLTRRVD